MKEISLAESIDSPKALDENLPKQVRHRLKSRTKGRSMKLIGDFHLLLGSYQEASALYPTKIIF